MEQITILLPGGFKPPHMGHVGLANKFASNPNVSKVIVMVGPAERNGITRQQSLVVWNLLPTNPKVKVISVTEDNPMNAAFNYVFNLPKESTETVALGASAKSTEDAKRSQIFVSAVERYKTKPTKDGKLAPKGVTAINMTDDSPSNYIGRTDDKNGQSISASILRQDLANKDLENFATNYPGVKTGIIKSIYNMLKKSKSMEDKEKLKETIRKIVNLVLKEQDLEKAQQDVYNKSVTAAKANVNKAIARQHEAREQETALKKKLEDLKKQLRDIEDSIRAAKMKKEAAGENEINTNTEDDIKNKEDKRQGILDQIKKVTNLLNVNMRKKISGLNQSLTAAKSYLSGLRKRKGTTAGDEYSGEDF